MLAALLAAAAMACGTQPRLAPVATPLGLDAYFPVPDDNPITGDKATLGRRLFFDTRLSRDRSVSCASCHRPERAFADTAARALGAHGRVGRRNAPSLVNVAYGGPLFWDGRAATLEEQVLQPIQDPLEMDLSLPELEARLREDRSYRRAFARGFEGRDAVTATNVARALATFLRTLRFGDSPLDRYRAGDTSALSPEERRGFFLFIGKAGCSACHIGPNLTDQSFHNTGISWERGDLGRYEVTGRDEDRGRFNTPSLRAAACTAPYMHDGSLGTLDEVVEFYGRGGNPNPNLDEDVRPLNLRDDETRALVAFLSSLRAGGCSPGVQQPPIPNP